MARSFSPDVVSYWLRLLLCLARNLQQMNVVTRSRQSVMPRAVERISRRVLLSTRTLTGISLGREKISKRSVSMESTEDELSVTTKKTRKEELVTHERLKKLRFKRLRRHEDDKGYNRRQLEMMKKRMDALHQWSNRNNFFFPFSRWRTSTKSIVNKGKGRNYFEERTTEVSISASSFFDGQKSHSPHVIPLRMLWRKKKSQWSSSLL